MRYCWFNYGACGTPHIQQLACIAVMSNTFLHEGPISEGASYVPFMCPPLWVTWPELAISVGTYIWAVRSPKRKSQAMWLNSWLSRHWHHFEIKEKPPCSTKSPCLEISPVAWNFTLIPWSLVPFSPFVVLLLMPSILLVVPFTCGPFAVLWSRGGEGKLRDWKTDQKAEKVMAYLTRLKWPFAETLKRSFAETLKRSFAEM